MVRGIYIQTTDGVVYVVGAYMLGQSGCEFRLAGAFVGSFISALFVMANHNDCGTSGADKSSSHVDRFGCILGMEVSYMAGLVGTPV